MDRVQPNILAKANSGYSLHPPAKAGGNAKNFPYTTPGI
jgi:hypothetical protein